MVHPLYGCERRFVRASRYIEETHEFMREWAGECEDRIIANYNTQRPIEFPDIPQDLPLAVSDAIHNLRTALDYLVYELAINDSGSIQEGTQFPLERVKSGISPNGNKIGFDAVVDRFLRGVSPSHRDAIEKLQPYNGCQWAQDLREISNPDKHRKLTAFSKRDSLIAWRGSNRRAKRLPSGDTVQVDPTHTIFIELPDRKIWVVHTLYAIQAAIVDTVNSFKPEFKI